MNELMEVDCRNDLIKRVNLELSLVGEKKVPAALAEEALSVLKFYLTRDWGDYTDVIPRYLVVNLIQGSLLSPLTGEPWEWEYTTYGLYVNKRYGMVYSKTGTPEGYAYDLGITLEERDGKIRRLEPGERSQITFPYFPRTLNTIDKV